MSSISTPNNDGFDRSEFRKDSSGHWVISIRAMARLAGVSREAVRKALKGGNQNPSKLAESLVAQGFCPDNLESWGDTGIPERAVPEILSYYAFDARKRSELARQVLINGCSGMQTPSFRTAFHPEAGGAGL